jgi:hypothetical protein
MCTDRTKVSAHLERTVEEYLWYDLLLYSMLSILRVLDSLQMQMMFQISTAEPNQFPLRGRYQHSDRVRVVSLTIGQSNGAADHD